MIPPTPTPSARLLEAAAAERDALARHRDGLVGARDRLRAELAAVERSLAEVGERSDLLERLIGEHAGDPGRSSGELVASAALPADVSANDEPGTDADARGRPDRESGAGAHERFVADAPVGTAADDERPTGATAVHPPRGVPAADERPPRPRQKMAPAGDGERPPGLRRHTSPATNAQAIDRGDRSGGLLRGPAIRRAAVEGLLAQADRPDALHYREWFDLIRAAGFDVAGKEPLAVFLTQLSRSPVIRRGTQAGVYELDVAAPARLGIELDRLHEDLRGLTARPEATADLAAIRARREQLTLAISQTEKALEEAEATLAAGRSMAAFAAAS